MADPWLDFRIGCPSIIKKRESSTSKRASSRGCLNLMKNMISHDVTNGSVLNDGHLVVNTKVTSELAPHGITLAREMHSGD